MDLKAYLKGAGVGIIVTAVILMIVGACNNNNKISDEDVIKRAKELGYVESSTLTSPSSLNGQDKENKVADADPDKKEPEVTEPDNNEPDTKEPDVTEADTKEPDVSEPDTKEPDTQVPDKQEPDNQEPDKKEIDNQGTEEYVIITIHSGQGSEEAARACKEAGLVDDSVAFNS